MNWAYFGLGVSAVLAAVWLHQTIKSRRTAASIYVSLGFLLLACMNAAAPVRGLVDPAYVGFGFGLLHAERGLSVTLAAGSVFVAGAACALIAARNRPGPLMLLVSAAGLAFLVIAGWPWLQGLISDPGANTIQFGEYLTIPGVIATLLFGVLQVGPFLVAVPWGLSRARAR